jgi:hypothetical protein
VQNLRGNLDRCLLSFRDTFRVDSLFSGRGWLHCCLFILVFVNVLFVELLNISSLPFIKYVVNDVNYFIILVIKLLTHRDVFNQAYKCLVTS